MGMTTYREVTIDDLNTLLIPLGLKARITSKSTFRILYIEGWPCTVMHFNDSINIIYSLVRDAIKRELIGRGELTVEAELLTKIINGTA